MTNYSSKHYSSKHYSSKHQRGQWTIIGSLVAIAILIALAAVYIPKMLKPATHTGEQHSAIQEGQGAACSVYTSQMNQAVSMYRSDHEGAAPPSLDDLKKYGVTDDMVHAPGCTFVMTNGIVTEVGHGAAPASAAPVTLAPGQPAAPASSAPANTTVGPGGIKIPTGSGADTSGGG